MRIPWYFEKVPRTKKKIPQYFIKIPWYFEDCRPKILLILAGIISIQTHLHLSTRQIFGGIVEALPVAVQKFE